MTWRIGTGPGRRWATRHSTEVADLTVAVPPIALAKQAAAASLGMSVDSFERYVQPHVRVIRRGKLRLIPVSELERWARENAEHLVP